MVLPVLSRHVCLDRVFHPIEPSRLPDFDVKTPNEGVDCAMNRAYRLLTLLFAYRLSWLLRIARSRL